MPLLVPPLGVVDFSFDRLTGSQLAAAGAAGVIRYAAAGRGDVNITAAEYADLAAHNIPTGITCELSATFMTAGRTAGRSYAQGALDVTRAAGMPDGPIFFAVDFDANDSYMPALLDTLNGCADILGPAYAGIYGSYDVIDWLVRNSPYVAFWQTAAWSGGRTHPHAWLIQDRIWTQATPYKLDGANVDFSTVLGNWHPRQEDDMSQADVDAINAHNNQLALTIVGAIVGAKQNSDGSWPHNLAQLALGIVSGYNNTKTALGTLPAAVSSAVVQHLPNVTVNQAALEAAVATAIDQHLSGATITLTPKAAS